MGHFSQVAINKQWTPSSMHGGLIIGSPEDSDSTPNIPEVMFVSPCARGLDTSTKWIRSIVAHRDLYDGAICGNLPGFVSCIAVCEDGVDFVSYAIDQLFVHRSNPSPSPWQPDSENFRSLDERSWITVTAYLPTGGFGESLDALREIVTSIRERSDLRLSDDVEALLDAAVREHGTPDDVEVWAHRLVDDVRDLTD